MPATVNDCRYQGSSRCHSMSKLLETHVMPDGMTRLLRDTDPEHRLTSERLQQWGMHMHVDHVFDLVPFWRRAVDAAERGEELRLESSLRRWRGMGGGRLQAKCGIY
ncbi:hypothetical protein EDD17DRAFT_588977 [Pisolithus thermaeus]|nr:hypothetical protein EDD17DRAFT_588977 [Pisolithus thermaeus]